MKSAPAEGIIVNNRTYVIGAGANFLTPGSMGKVSNAGVLVNVTEPPQVDEYRANESGEVAHRVVHDGLTHSYELRSMEDVYHYFPFLRESNLSPEAQTLHDALVAAVATQQ